MKSYAADYIKLLDAGIKITLFAAELDTQDGARGMELWLEEVFCRSTEKFKDFFKTPKNTFFYNSLDSRLTSPQVGGYWRS